MTYDWNSGDSWLLVRNAAEIRHGQVLCAVPEYPWFAVQAPFLVCLALLVGTAAALLLMLTKASQTGTAQRCLVTLVNSFDVAWVFPVHAKHWGRKESRFYSSNNLTKLCFLSPNLVGLGLPELCWEAPEDQEGTLPPWRACLEVYRSLELLLLQSYFIGSGELTIWCKRDFLFCALAAWLSRTFPSQISIHTHDNPSPVEVVTIHALGTGM